MDRHYIPAGQIEVRYRDVPFETVKGCYNPATDNDAIYWENNFRGQTVVIWTPPIPNDFMENGFVYTNGDVTYKVTGVGACPSGCQGPFYGIRGYQGSVCGHLVEIGD